MRSSTGVGYQAFARILSLATPAANRLNFSVMGSPRVCANVVQRQRTVVGDVSLHAPAESLTNRIVVGSRSEASASGTNPRIDAPARTRIWVVASAPTFTAGIGSTSSRTVAALSLMHARTPSETVPAGAEAISL